MDKVDFSVFNEEINRAADETAKNTCREVSNIEDQIRVANEMFTGLNHYCPQKQHFVALVILNGK